MGRRVVGTVFLTVERDRKTPARLSPVKVTSRYPAHVEGQIVIQLRLDVPASAFAALVAPDVILPEVEQAALAEVVSS